jgi:phosphoribosylformylglycinamidine synthase
VHNVKYSPAPLFELDQEYELQQIIKLLIHGQLINSAHDISEGGLFVCLLESGFFNELGFSISLEQNLRKDGLLFGEAQCRIVVAVAPEKIAAVRELIGSFPARQLGVVTSGEIIVDGTSWGNIGEWKSLYDTAIEKHLVKEESAGALTLI